MDEDDVESFESAPTVCTPGFYVFKQSYLHNLEVSQAKGLEMIRQNCNRGCGHCENNARSRYAVLSYLHTIKIYD